jgi:cobalt-zinc-cadmium efflux system outer membrane protein
LLAVLQLPLLAVAGPETFTLQSAIDYALTNNLDLRVLESRKTAAEAEIRTQSQLNNPSFVGEITRSQPNYFVGAGYLFELGGKRHTRMDVASNEAAVARLDLLGAERDLRHDVRVAFYTLLQGRSKVREVRTSRDLAARLLSITRERFDAGDVAKLEVLQAELELKRRENEATQVDNETKASAARLNLLLNRYPQDPITLQGALEQTATEVNLESLVQNAVRQRVEILAGEAQQRAQQGRLSLARKERIPDLQMEAGTEIHDTEFQYGWRGNLSFELPIFNLRKGEIAGATATLQSLRYEEESQKKKVRSEVTENFLLYQAAAFRVENFRKELLPATTELEKLSEDSYHEGKTSLVSTFDAQRNSLQVRLEYLDALLDYQKAVADLEKSAVMTLP